MKKARLKFNARFIGLYLMVGYVSWQLHELAHWLTAMLVNVNIILGFDHWRILSSPGVVATTLTFAAGPAMSFFLVLLGIFLLRRSKRPFLRLAGLSLTFFTSVIMMVSLVLGSLMGASFDFASSEYSWKLLFFPAFAALLFLGLRSLKAGLTKTVRWGLVLLALAVGFALLISAIDWIVWSGIKTGSPFFAPIFGISAPVILVNAVVFMGFALICKRNLVNAHSSDVNIWVSM